MRLLIASLAALAAVAFAAPSYAQTQDDSSPAQAPVPTAKPKPGTAAYCQSLKTSSSRSSCLKKVSASAKATTTKASATTTAKKTKKTTTTPAAPKQPDVGQLSTPSAAPAPSGTVAVPPLPQKTI
jgi:hypothetical protein